MKNMDIRAKVAAAALGVPDRFRRRRANRRASGALLVAAKRRASGQEAREICPATETGGLASQVRQKAGAAKHPCYAHCEFYFGSSAQSGASGCR